MIIDCTRDGYDEIDAVHFSTLKALARSPAAYRYLLDMPREDSDTLAFGRLVHALVLEPDTVDGKWAVWDGKVRRGAEWNQFLVDNAGKEILRAQDLDPAMALASAVHAHPVAAQWLADFEPEVTVVWDDAETGIKCKCRLDGVSPELAFDLKTAGDSSERAMAYAMLRYSYHAQAAMYLDALAAAGRTVSTYGLIAAEKAAPHKVRCYTLSAAAVDAGRTLYRGWLRTLTECRTANVWPAWLPGEEQVSELDLPPWLMPGCDDPGLDMTGLKEE